MWTRILLLQICQPVLLSGTGSLVDGAKVAPYYLVSEADGIGPWTVKYSTPGLKTIKLTTGLLSKDVDCEDTLIYDTRERQKYVNVIDNDQDIGEIKGPENLCAGQEGIFEVNIFTG